MILTARQFCFQCRFSSAGPRCLFSSVFLVCVLGMMLSCLLFYALYKVTYHTYIDMIYSPSGSLFLASNPNRDHLSQPRPGWVRGRAWMS